MTAPPDAALIQAVLAAAKGDSGSDESISEELNPTPAGALQARAPTPAAVLVPLVEREDGLTVLLTQRTEHLAHHAGQISFPGGRAEEGDIDAADTALRETEEEIGLPREQVTLLGQLGDYMTGTGFCVTPVVGLIRPPFEVMPDPFEVAEVFEVPLRHFLDPANHQRGRYRTKEGRERAYYAMPYGPRYIWGATAGMLMAFYRLLTPHLGADRDPPSGTVAP